VELLSPLLHTSSSCAAQLINSGLCGSNGTLGNSAVADFEIIFCNLFWLGMYRNKITSLCLINHYAMKAYGGVDV
jgi:hypothetical protein